MCLRGGSLWQFPWHRCLPASRHSWLPTQRAGSTLECVSLSINVGRHSSQFLQIYLILCYQHVGFGSKSASCFSLGTKLLRVCKLGGTGFECPFWESVLRSCEVSRGAETLFLITGRNGTCIVRTFGLLACLCSDTFLWIYQLISSVKMVPTSLSL